MPRRWTDRGVRPGATCGNGRAHSGSRWVADKDEVAGSSPGRPTTSDNQRERCFEGTLGADSVAVQRITPRNWVTSRGVTASLHALALLTAGPPPSCAATRQAAGNGDNGREEPRRPA